MFPLHWAGGENGDISSRYAHTLKITDWAQSGKHGTLLSSHKNNSFCRSGLISYLDDKCLIMAHAGMLE